MAFQSLERLKTLLEQGIEQSALTRPAVEQHLVWTMEILSNLHESVILKLNLSLYRLF